MSKVRDKESIQTEKNYEILTFLLTIIKIDDWKVIVLYEFFIQKSLSGLNLIQLFVLFTFSLY